MLLKEKQKEFFFLSFQFSAQLSPPLFRARPVFPSPCPAWAEPSNPPLAQQARVSARAACLSLRVTDAAGPCVGASSSSPRRAIFFLVHHRSNPPPISLPSLFRAPQGYKSRMPHPSALYCTEAGDRHRPEEAMREP
jgi:hypothetical protein